MKKIFLILLMLAVILPAFASYTIVMPERFDCDYQIMTDDGELLSLDESIYYKRWIGLLAENLDTGIYMITEDGNSVIAVMDGTDERMLYNAIAFTSADTIIIPEKMNADPEILAASDITDAVLFSHLSELQERLYKNSGIEITYSHPGDLLNISDGRPVINDGRNLIVLCPHCGNQIEIYIPSTFES